jgi:predicted DNA-binding transcriptional regulator AlpA
VQDIEAVKVLNRRDAIAQLGLSERTFQRLEANGDGPAKTRLSEGRVGYRVCDLKDWLDARRENLKPIGCGAAKIVRVLR